MFGSVQLAGEQDIILVGTICKLQTLQPELLMEKMKKEMIDGITL